MDNDQYIIQRYVFDIGFDKRSKVFELHNRFSRLFYEQALPVMENSFREFLPGQHIIQLDRMDLDIGVLRYDRIEKDFAEKFRESLEKELTLILARVSESKVYEKTDPDVQDLNHSLSAFLQYYLLTGFLPWWAYGNMYKDPVAVAEHFIGNDPPALKQLLINAGQFDYVRKRIVFLFPHSVVKAIVNILEPEHAVFIIGYHSDVIKIQQQEQVIKNEVSEFEKAVWLFILTFLLRNKESHFNRKAFVRYTLRQMAMHYGLQYEDILEIFFVALKKDDPALKFTGSLQNILMELELERVTDTVQRKVPAETDQQQDMPAAAVLLQQFEIVRYFLVFGSLPPQAGPYDAAGLSALVSALIKMIPATIKRTIAALAVKETIQQRIADILEEYAIKDIVRLEEPANAEFIFRYTKTLQAQYHEKSLIKTESNSFRKSVWQFILAFLFTEKGSVFNTRMFLKSHIHQLAQHYHLTYGQLLVFLVQGIGEEIQSEEDSSLFHLLIVIMQEHNEEQKTLPAGSVRLLKQSTEINKDVRADNEKLRVIGLRDMLVYWLQYDRDPWWAGSHQNNTVSSLWEELRAISPAEILWLLQYAGLNESITRRLVQRLSPEILLAAFQLFPQGTVPVQSYKSLYGSLLNNSSIRIRDMMIVRAEWLLILWQVFREDNYAGFNARQFIQKSIEWLSGFTNLYPGVVIRSLIKTIERYKETADYTELGSQLKYIYLKMQDVSIINPVILSNANMPGVEILISQYILHVQAAGKEDILREVIRMLEYFLQGKALPGPFAGISAPLKNALLKQLLQWLHRERPFALRELLEQRAESATARMQLHDIFWSSHTASEKEIQSLLLEYSDTDMFHFLVTSSANIMEAGNETSIGIIKAAINRMKEPAIMEWFRTLVHSATMVRFLVNRYNKETLYELITIIHPGPAKNTVHFLQEMEQLFGSFITGTTDREKFNLLFREFIFLNLPGELLFKDHSVFLAAFLHFINDRQPAIIVELDKWLGKAASSIHGVAASTVELINLVKHQVMQFLAREKKHSVLEHSRQTTNRLALESVFGRDYSKEEGLAFSRLAHELQQQQKQKSEEQKERAGKIVDMAGASLYIRNAGLVLLHPLLTALFNRLQWMDKNKFVNEETQYRAVHLLQYIAYGTEQYPEHELVLNKLLCGMLPQDPLPADILLTEQEKMISTELLKVVLQRWEKLKNTSIEGLQVSFLQREGSLVQTTDHWKLQVQQRGIDVLLAYLPWGFGMIKTLWMPKTLYVEWT